MEMTIIHPLGVCMIATVVLWLPGSCEGAGTATENGTLGFIGTYTGAKSKGIYSFRLDSAGIMSSPTLAAETPNPTFLALHPNGQFLYAANEVGNFAGKSSGAVTAFAIDPKTGQLTQLNQQPSGGGGPCHLVVDPTGKNVLVANYGAGSIEVLPVGKDGRLGEPSAFVQHRGSSINRDRQSGPHAHFITTDPSDRFALTCDLGLDQVLVYRFDADKGTLTPNDPPAGMVAPGSGARHLAFSANGGYGYVISEMACTITAFQYDAKRGELKPFQTVSTLPNGEMLRPSYSTAEVAVHPSGKFLYGSNRGHNSIVVFEIDPKTGRLTYVENQPTQGKTPRHFAVDPTGRYLLAENQDSDSIAGFRVDAKTGRLNPTGQLLEGIGAPVCIQFIAR